MTLPTANPEPIGVIYLPFQVAYLPDQYTELIDKMLNIHKHVLIALPIRRITPSKRSPLDFFTRQYMIQERYGSAVTVVAVGNEKYEDRMISVFETAVKAPFSEMRGKVALYTDDAFAAIYKTKGGKWRVEIVDGALELEESSRKATTYFDMDARDMGVKWATRAIRMYRIGVIEALRSQFPISWSTVDICIKRNTGGNTYILLGRKPGEHGWRFPGGFKDMEDESYEVAVWREAGEEVLKEGVNKEEVLTYPTYIGSRRINDWRYRGEIDGITTLFYQVEFIGGDDNILAGDDLGETKWFTLQEITEDMLEGEHVHLFRMLQKYEGIDKP
jgi:bifunctional NMN adenylyltransferase/nudix hydrolase